MQVVPYFLYLIQKNAVLYALVMTGNFSAIDLKKLPHQMWSEAGIELLDFTLSSEEKFPSVMVGLWPKEQKRVTLRFRTTSSRYFDEPIHYFGKDGMLRSSNIIFNSQHSLTQRKIVGQVFFPERDVFVTIYQSPKYGNTLTLDFRPLTNKKGNDHYY